MGLVALQYVGTSWTRNQTHLSCIGRQTLLLSHLGSPVIVIRLLLWDGWVSLVAQRVKHLPAMQETQVRSLSQEDSLEKEMATHSSILAWRILDGGAW